jgi:hypothetical protein
LKVNVLRRISGHKRVQVTREWRYLQSEKLNYLYSSPNIIRVIKSRKMRLEGYVALWGRGKMHTGFRWGRLMERAIEKPWHRWEVNINTDLQEVGWRAWTGLIWLRKGTGGGHL